MTMRRPARLAMLIAAALAIAGAVDGAAEGVADDETPEQYPAGPHRDDTFYFCTACHSFKIVAAQGMSRARWDESLDWMVPRHSMPDDGEDAKRSSTIWRRVSGARAPGGWKNPFAPR